MVLMDPKQCLIMWIHRINDLKPRQRLRGGGIHACPAA